MDRFLQILDMPIMQRAILACLLIGFANGYVSAFVVLRKSALKIGTLSHGLLPGIAIAVLIAGGVTQWSVLAGAALAALLLGLGSLFVSRTSRLDQDTALAILYTGGFAAGLIIVRYLGIRAQLDEWLFGALMGMTDGDMWIAWGISATAILILTAFQRPILITLFQPDVAASLGIPVRLLNYALLAVVILVLVSSLQAVGCVMSLGLLVTPAATVFMFTNSAPALFWGGGLLGALVSAASMIVAHQLDLPAGATLIVLLTACFVLAYLLSPRYGLLFRKSSPAA